VVSDAVKQFASGLQGYWKGIRWLIKRPSTFALLAIPWCLGAFGLSMCVYLIWTYGDSFVTAVLGQWFSVDPENSFAQLFYNVSKFCLWLSMFFLSVVFGVIIVSIAASPVYELISMRIEEDLLGRPSLEVPWSRVPKILIGEALKGFVVISVPLVMMIIPGVNLFVGVATAFLLGWSFYDFPLARRGWSFNQRWMFVRSEFWTVLGFGVWLAIPFVQMVLVPMAVAGGTILNVEALMRRGMATQLKQGGSL